MPSTTTDQQQCRIFDQHKTCENMLQLFTLSFLKQRLLLGAYVTYGEAIC